MNDETEQNQATPIDTAKFEPNGNEQEPQKAIKKKRGRPKLSYCTKCKRPL